MNSTPQITEHSVPAHVHVGQRQLVGDLVIPAHPVASVVFAHGSGSSRLSPRNRFVATALRQRGFATLLMDLLGEDEEDDRKKVFDINLLADRLEASVRWLLGHEGELAELPIGLFGASTGAAAALMASVPLGRQVHAIVSRGGRPDLAGAALPQVQAPTLLVVGGNDEVVIELNREAYSRMTCEKELVIVPGATHLFPEPGALEEVAELAGKWFAQHLT